MSDVIWVLILINFLFGLIFFSRYFANVTVRDEHFKTKKHKKRYVYVNMCVYVYKSMCLESGNYL